MGYDRPFSNEKKFTGFLLRFIACFREVRSFTITAGPKHRNASIKGPFGQATVVETYADLEKSGAVPEEVVFTKHRSTAPTAHIGTCKCVNQIQRIPRTQREHGGP